MSTDLDVEEVKAVPHVPVSHPFVERLIGKVRNVRIAGQGRVAELRNGGRVTVRMEVLHDCISCDNAINQVIVGIAGEQRAQTSVWNGKKRSGGPLMVVNRGTSVEAYAQDNPGPAEWVEVSFDLDIPEQAGSYCVRTRYAQDYQGLLLTADAPPAHAQPDDSNARGWWRVDRPNGPGPESNIGAVIIE